MFRSGPVLFRSPAAAGDLALLVLDVELLLEAINPSTCIYQLLLAGKEGGAMTANFHMDVLLGGACLDLGAASALDRGPIVLGMNALFHYFSPRISFIALLQAQIILPQRCLECKRFL